jgi:hypothetical protein
MYITDNINPESFYQNFESPEQEYEDEGYDRNEDVSFTEEDMEEVIEDEI